MINRCENTKMKHKITIRCYLFREIKIDIEKDSTGRGHKPKGRMQRPKNFNNRSSCNRHTSQDKIKFILI